MRYNPDTERGISLEQIAEQCRTAILGTGRSLAQEPAMVWDCQSGRGWIQNPAISV